MPSTPPLPTEDAVDCKTVSRTALWLLSAAMLASLGCEGKVNFANNPPSNVALTRDRCYIWTGGAIRFTASAVDEDGDPLTFTWKATKGSFDPPSATGTAVSWIAPDAPGTATITMSVTDELVTVTKTADVIVCVPFPEDIVTMTIKENGYLYILKKDTPVRVPEGSTLTIEPGVIVIIDNRYGGIFVEGTLRALGTHTRHIKFLGNTFSGGSAYWGGIYVDGLGSRVELRNVEVANGDDGVQANNMALMELDSCIIYDNSSVGVQATEMSVANVRGCRIIQNGTGAYMRNSEVRISRSSISDSDGTGIEMSAGWETVSVVLDSSVVANNRGNGIILTNRVSPRIHYCSLFNADPTPGSYMVRLDNYASEDSVHMEYNYWGPGFDANKIAGVICDRSDVGRCSSLAWVGFTPWLDYAPVNSTIK
jgi:hypothetical protein